MANGQVRHMFPGGNTSKGFFSYYDYVLPQERAKRIFILKGGPGVGKSTFMKKIAEQMCLKGYDAEFMHCSSDPSSLDGVVFPEIQVALLDGTAPHIVDPKNPGAVDEIINLGIFWREEGFSENKEKIIKTNQEIGRIFARAYRYLQAAFSIYKDNEVIHGWAMDDGKANVAISHVVDDIFTQTKVSAVEGKQRHLFASAITPDGLVNYLTSILTTEKLVSLQGVPGTGTERLVERVRQAATERGFDTESYYCALNPNKLEHLIIPALDIAVTTRNEVHDTDQAATMSINFNDYLDNTVLSRYQHEIQYNQQEYKKLLERAIQTIRQAKSLHDDLEKYYIPNMNFDGVQKTLEEVLSKLQ